MNQFSSSTLFETFLLPHIAAQIFFRANILYTDFSATATVFIACALCNVHFCGRQQPHGAFNCIHNVQCAWDVGRRCGSLNYSLATWCRFKRPKIDSKYGKKTEKKICFPKFRWQNANQIKSKADAYPTTTTTTIIHRCLSIDLNGGHGERALNIAVKSIIFIRESVNLTIYDWAALRWALARVPLHAKWIRKETEQGKERSRTKTKIPQTTHKERKCTQFRELPHDACETNKHNYLESRCKQHTLCVCVCVHFL